MSKRLAIVLAVMLGMLAFAAVASAEPKVDSSQRLRVQVDPHQSGCDAVDSMAGWVTGQDSPSDSNQRLFHTNVGTGGRLRPPVLERELQSPRRRWEPEEHLDPAPHDVGVPRPELHGGRGQHRREQLDDRGHALPRSRRLQPSRGQQHDVGPGRLHGLQGRQHVHDRRGLASVGDVLVRRGPTRRSRTTPSTTPGRS